MYFAALLHIARLIPRAWVRRKWHVEVTAASWHRMVSVAGITLNPAPLWHGVCSGSWGQAGFPISLCVPAGHHSAVRARPGHFLSSGRIGFSRAVRGRSLISSQAMSKRGGALASAHAFLHSSPAHSMSLWARLTLHRYHAAREEDDVDERPRIT